jgi:hypothetical protein
LLEKGVLLLYEMVAAQLYYMCGVLLLLMGVWLLYEMVAAQLYDM